MYISSYIDVQQDSAVKHMIRAFNGWA